MEHSYESQIWAIHHNQFSRWVSDAAAAIGRGLGRFAGWDGSTPHLAAIVAAFAMTLVTFRGTVV